MGIQSTFIGVDLAWNTDGNHTGVAVLQGSADGVELAAVSEGLTSRKDVVQFIAANLGRTSVVAIDASLVVPNGKGQRQCERRVSKKFGRYHASCHTTHRGRKYWDAGGRLLEELRQHDVRHDFDLARARQRSGGWAFEVYPHPAMLQLFGLDRIISYKKGPVADRRKGLRILQSHLYALVSRSPGLVENSMLRNLLDRDVTDVKGEALKRYEDTLDALFCAYLAWYCWRWGEEKNEIFGTLSEGYIVVPRGHIE